MYRQLHLLRLALIAAVLAMLAAALVPPVMQMLNPVAIATNSAGQDDMPGCTDPGMMQMHHNKPDGGQQAQSCPMCSLFCHIPALPGLPALTLLAPLNHWLIILPIAGVSWTAPAFTTPPARAPPATLV
jgi:hypothetical protein